jgi:uncharacterized cupredoxin-like copper-binding protein
MKRTFTLLAACAAAGVTLFVVAPFAGARLGAQASTTVKVTAKEYKFILSRKSAPHGTVVFKVVNKGKIKHDFKIAGKKTKRLGHGQTATLRVKLTKGKHKYICTVPGHTTLGMKGTFKAT